MNQKGVPFGFILHPSSFGGGLMPDPIGILEAVAAAAVLAAAVVLLGGWPWRKPHPARAYFGSVLGGFHLTVGELCSQPASRSPSAAWRRRRACRSTSYTARRCAPASSICARTSNERRLSGRNVADRSEYVRDRHQPEPGQCQLSLGGDPRQHLGGRRHGHHLDRRRHQQSPLIRLKATLRSGMMRLALHS